MKIEGKKRIVITCPKCHHEYSFNGDALFQRKRALAEQIKIIEAKKIAFKEEHPDCYKKNPYYLKLQRSLEETRAQLSEVKTDYANASHISELNLHIAFKKKCMQEFGREKIIRMLEECEEEMQFNDYDLAKQTYTNFNNV